VATARSPKGAQARVLSRAARIVQVRSLPPAPIHHAPKFIRANFLGPDHQRWPGGAGAAAPGRASCMQ
jgi:hypothetical protein